MKTRFLTLLLALAAVTDWQRAAAQGTAFTYQGRLNANGAPAGGSYDFRFQLAADPVTNNYVGSPVLTNGVAVTNGLFTVALNFGAGIFNGSNYWLEVDVRTNGAVSYTNLSPRQAVTPAPYAIMANSASNLLGTLQATQLSGTIQNGALPASPVFSGTVTAGSLSGNGAGVSNVNAASLSGLNAANFWQLGGNNVSTGQILGSTNNQPVEVWVNGQRALRLESDAGTNGSPNVVEGSKLNFVSNGVFGATIGGGGATNYVGFPYINSVTGIFGTVGGGGQNTVNGFAGTVGGGNGNISSNNYSTIGGGSGNTVSGTFAVVSGGSGNTANGLLATISGGEINTASANMATIGGGYGNSAVGYGASVGGGGYDGSTFLGNQAGGNASVVSGGLGNSATNSYASVPGGAHNIAGGQYSFAAGQQAQALHQGAFVWADSLNAVFASTNNDSFNVRAQGGARFVTGGAGMTIDGQAVLISGVNMGLTIQQNSSGAPNVIEGAKNNFVSNGVVGATIGGGGATNYLALSYTNRVTADFGTVSGGAQNAASGQYAVVGGGYQNTAGGTLATVAGGSGNSAGGNGAFIGGGGYDGTGSTPGNQAGGNAAVIGGGTGNNAGGYAATIGGGQNNINNGSIGTIAGGQLNQILQPSNTVYQGSIGGGYNNLVINSYATVPGGSQNVAGGRYSFAAGQQAQALQQGAFVWADSQNAVFASTTNDEFSVRAQNGVRLQTDKGIHLNAADEPLIVRDWDAFATNAPASKIGIGRWGLFMEPSTLTIGIPSNDVANRFFQVAKYATNGAYTTLVKVDQSGNVTTLGTVTANGVLLTSDRNAKENFAPLDTRAVLEKVGSLPLTQWNYKNDAARQKHVGPMAQDFHAAFGLNGGDDQHISVVDESGVALAAIQGLNQKVEELKAGLKRREAENAELKERLSALEKLIGQKGSPTTDESR